MAQRSAFERVASDLGGELTAIQRLSGGSSATVHALDLVDGAATRRVIHRRYPETTFKGEQSPGVMGEFAVLRALHATGLKVAEPLLVDEEEQSLVLEWIEGTTHVADRALDDALDQMAEFLVGLHCLAPESLHLQLADLEDPRSGVQPYLPRSPVGDRARVLLAEVPLRPNQSVLIHGDYWPGNVLWHEGRLAAVIDWEDAQAADPLADLACARVELLCQYGAAAMALFTDRYLTRMSEAANALVTDSLPVWEIYVSASALSTMHLWGLDEPEESRRRSMTTAFFERAVSELPTDAPPTRRT